MSVRKGNNVLAGSTPLTIDSELSTTSANPIQNKAVANAVATINTALGTKANASDVYTKDETDTLLSGKVSTGHEVIAFQAPTTQNNYTWYRKYADGWVEQGGRCHSTSSIPLPVLMSDTNYSIQITGVGITVNDVVTIFSYTNITTSGFDFVGLTIQSNGTIMADTSNNRSWEVKGIAA